MFVVAWKLAAVPVQIVGLDVPTWILGVMMSSTFIMMEPDVTVDVTWQRKVVLMLHVMISPSRSVLVEKVAVFDPTFTPFIFH